MEPSLEQTLKEKNVRPTAVRLMVLRSMRDADCAVSLSDLESMLDTVDRSTIFRSLTTFVDSHIAHAVNDGSGQIKYALCPPTCHCHEDDNPDFNDLHAHFYCVVCHKTFCLRSMPVPFPTLDPGFKIQSASYILSGLCPKCSSRSRK